MDMENKIDDKKELRRLFLRSGFIFGSFNMVKMMGQGFGFTMNRTIDKLYKDNEEARLEAQVRHNEFFNCHAAMLGLIVGITYAMEKEKSLGRDIDGDAITNIKVALMGPLAGIGDSLFFNTIRIIAAGVGIGLAQQGSILGALIFILIYGGSFLLVKGLLLKFGYSMGTSFLDKLYEGGMIQNVSKAASILGLIMVGSMVASMVNINIVAQPVFGGAPLNIQEMLDSIMPGILSLGLLFGVMKLIKKKVKVTWILIGLIIICILLAFLGIL